MRVDEAQITQIRGYLLGNGITNHSLQDDLLDHFCCSIEDRMEEGGSFDRAFADAVERITPDGPAKIQNDLNYLLTIKKRIMLRKIVFTVAYFSVYVVLLAIALRFPQIISADLTSLLIMVGILLFSLSAVPFFFYEMYQRSVRRLKEAE